MALLFKTKCVKSLGYLLLWLHLWMFKRHGQKPGFTEIIWAGEKSVKVNHNFHDVKLAHRLFTTWYYVDMHRMDNKASYLTIKGFWMGLELYLDSWSIVHKGSGSTFLIRGQWCFNLQLHYSWTINKHSLGHEIIWFWLWLYQDQWKSFSSTVCQRLVG